MIERNIIYNEKKINFSDTGKGDAVVFLHGFLESLIIWRSFSEKLSANYRVICIDLPGHGKSDGFSDIHTMESMAEGVKSVLDHLNIEKCALIGHSMGGYVTLAFADLYPGYLSGIGLFHSAAHADSPEAASNRERAIQAIQSDHTQFITHFIPDLFAKAHVSSYQKEINILKEIALTIEKENIIAALKGMKQRKDNRPLLKNMEIPVFFIIGKEDSRIPTDLAKEQVGLPKNSSMLLLEEVGHMGYIEAAEETFQFIEDFLKKVEF
ncbi:MAG: alpha/beta hydrolase [Bacteroidales bacterium]|nr:alpha/beta hydrolase [Bacteroidales bacterium]